jgi:hypothetical protein
MKVSKKASSGQTELERNKADFDSEIGMPNLISWEFK